MPERTRELSLLIIGDLLVFVLALFLTLTLRYLALPSGELLALHLLPFFLMSLVWVVVFYISGLYDKQIVPAKARFVARILSAQFVNVLLAGVIFLLVPFGITPKTNLAIYLGVSAVLLTLWRWFVVPRLAPKNTTRALLIAEGSEALELAEEVNSNTRYPYYIHSFVKPSTLEVGNADKLLRLIAKEQITLCIVDGRRVEVGPQLHILLSAMMSQQQFVIRNFTDVYEATFDKVPLSVVDDQWSVSVASQQRSGLYRVLKRLVDIFFGCVLLFLLALFLPFIWLIEKIKGEQGPLFIAQDRVGKYGRPISIYKLRTMTENRSATSDWTANDAMTGNIVTPVGAVLRKLSIDELPQGLAMIRGDMSIIGPRSDIAGIAEKMRVDIPHYTTRLLVVPGLSGWAQTNQRYQKGNISPQSLEETKERLAYDLYYVKHQSLLLDMTIVLKSIKAVMVRMVSIFSRG